MDAVHFMVNPKAARGRAARLVESIRLVAQARGRAAQVHVCDGLDALARSFAAMPAGQRVVAVGGDGTCHRMLPHVLAGRHELAVLPAGSGNDWARANGLWGRDMDGLIAHALEAPARPVDVGLLENLESGEARHFLCCMLFGLDAHVSNLTQGWKVGGPLPYTLTLLGLLPRLPAWSLAIEAEGATGPVLREPEQARLMCSLLNTPTYGSGYPVAPMARIDDGHLHLLMLPKVGRWRFMQLFLDLLRGRHVHAPEFSFCPVQGCRVSSADALCLSADGEDIGWQTRSARARVLPAALNMVTA